MKAEHNNFHTLRLKACIYFNLEWGGGGGWVFIHICTHVEHTELSFIDHKEHQTPEKLRFNQTRPILFPVVVMWFVLWSRRDNFVQLWTVKNGADFCYPVSFALCIFHYPSRVPKVYQTLRRWRVWIHQLSEEAFLTRAFQDTGVLSESGNLCYLFIHANINDFRDIQIHVCQCNVGPNEIIHLYCCGFCCCCFFALKKNDNGQRFGAD